MAYVKYDVCKSITISFISPEELTVFAVGAQAFRYVLVRAFIRAAGVQRSFSVSQVSKLEPRPCTTKVFHNPSVL